MKKAIELSAMVVAISLLVIHNQELSRKAERELEVLQNQAQTLKEEEMQLQIKQSEKKALELRSTED